MLTRLCRLTRGTQGPGKLAPRSAFTPHLGTGQGTRDRLRGLSSNPALPQPSHLRAFGRVNQPVSGGFFFSIVNCFETMTDVLWLLNESTGPWTDVNGYKAPKHRAVVREGVMGPREVVQTWRRSRNRSPPRSRAVWVADLRSLTPTCALPSHRHGQLRGRRETPERLPRRGRCHPRPAHLQLSAAAGDLVSGRPQDPAQQPHVSVPLPDPQGRV